ncbi:hypothetical protein RCO48_11990 [Peribacillus frigoritolerans]|nr:hypothetical protein [Peribacillus frigoritolerans]
MVVLNRQRTVTEIPSTSIRKNAVSGLLSGFVGAYSEKKIQSLIKDIPLYIHVDFLIFIDIHSLYEKEQIDLYIGREY